MFFSRGKRSNKAYVPLLIGCQSLGCSYYCHGSCSQSALRYKTMLAKLFNGVEFHHDIKPAKAFLPDPNNTYDGWIQQWG